MESPNFIYIDVDSKWMKHQGAHCWTWSYGLGGKKKVDKRGLVKYRCPCSMCVGGKFFCQEQPYENISVDINEIQCLQNSY